MFELTTQSLNNSLNKVLDFSPESLILGNAVRSSTAQHRIMGTLRSATLKKKLASVAPDSDEARRITDEINNFLSSVEKTEAEEIFQAMDRLFLLQRMQKNIGKLKPEDVVSVEASAGVSKEDIISFLKRKEAENVLEIDALSAKISTYKANNSTKIIPKVMEKEVGKLPDVSVEP
jgi:TusA-related sulfurtransferase